MWRRLVEPALKRVLVASARREDSQPLRLGSAPSARRYPDASESQATSADTIARMGLVDRQEAEHGIA
jgi:hypothetical protein